MSFGSKSAPPAVYAPSKDDERQRMVAQQAQLQKGGRQTTILTSGLAAPAAPGPQVRAPINVLTS